MLKHWGPCGLCKVTKNVFHYRATDCDICFACYRREFGVRDRCSICLKISLVAKRIEKGKPVCSNCYRKHVRKREPCVQCAQMGIVAKRTVTGEAICENCYNRAYSAPGYTSGSKRYSQEPKRPAWGCCTLCRQMKNVFHHSGAGGGGDVCWACYASKLKPRPPCSVCGVSRRVVARIDSKPLCHSCWRDHKSAHPR